MVSSGYQYLPFLTCFNFMDSCMQFMSKKEDCDVFVLV